MVTSVQPIIRGLTYVADPNGEDVSDDGAFCEKAVVAAFVVADVGDKGQPVEA
jgi:hypothetical protein